MMLGLSGTGIKYRQTYNSLREDAVASINKNFMRAIKVLYNTFIHFSKVILSTKKMRTYVNIIKWLLTIDWVHGMGFLLFIIIDYRHNK